MASSKAATVDAYLADLPRERREMISEVRDMVLKHLPKGYEESMGYGMIGYGVPLERYPDTYNGHPLCYAAIASQKNYCSLYVMTVYGDKKKEAQLRDAFKNAGKKLDMGKACIRFTSADDLPLAAIGEIIASVPPEKYIEVYEKSRLMTKAGARKAAAAAKPAAKTARKKTR